MFHKLRLWWLIATDQICPDCHREDWNNDEEHGYNHKYNHCIWCGYCTYIQRWTGKRGHNE